MVFPPLDQFFYQFFLPFALFYILFFALLQKSEIFGKKEETKNLNIGISLVLALIAAISIYSLGMISYLINIVTAIAIGSFVGLFLYGSLRWATQKTEEYSSEEGLLKGEIEFNETKFEELKRKREQEKDENKKKKIEEEMKNVAKNIKESSRKICNLLFARWKEEKEKGKKMKLSEEIKKWNEKFVKYSSILGEEIVEIPWREALEWKP